MSLSTALDIVECGNQVMKSAVAVPQSIPGLVTKDILVMTFLEGEQITRLKVCTLCKTVTWSVWAGMCRIVTQSCHMFHADMSRAHEAVSFCLRYAAENIDAKRHIYKPSLSRATQLPGWCEG